MIEHRTCFPWIGEITVHGLKVNRKRHFYHLPDSMLIRSAFDRVEGDWFLNVYASSDQAGPTENLLYLKPGPSSNLQNLGVEKITDENCKCLFDIYKNSDSEVPKNANLVTKENEGATLSLHEKEKSKSKTEDMQCENTLEASQPEPVAKKKLKYEKKNEDSFHKPAEGPWKENDAESKEISKPKFLSQVNHSEDKKKRKIGSLDEVSTNPLGDEGLFPTSFGKKRRKMKKKKKSSLSGQVDSAVPTGKNLRLESFEGPLGNNHNDLGEEADAAITSQRTIKSAILTNPSVISEEEKHCTPVQEVEGPTIPASPLGGSIVSAEKVVLDDVAAVGSNDHIGTNVESKKDDSNQAMAFEGRKTRGRKKHRNLASLIEESDGITKDIITSLVHENVLPEDGNHGNGHTNKTTEENVLTRGRKKLRNLAPLAEESDGITKNTITSLVHENVLPEDGNHGIGHTNKTTEENVLSKIGDPEKMSLEALSSKCMSLGQNETETNTEGAVSSKLLDNSGILEVKNPVHKRKKKSKKAKDSDGKEPVSYSTMEHAAIVGNVTSSRLESPGVFNRDHQSNEIKKEDNVSLMTEKTKGLKVNKPHAPLEDLDKDIKKASGNEVDSSPPDQLTIQETAHNSDEKLKKKSKKTQISTVKDSSDLPMKEQDIGSGDPLLSTHEKKEEPTPSKKKRKRTRGTSSVDHLAEPILKDEKDGTRIEHTQIYKTSEIVESSQISLDMLEKNVERRHAEIGVKDDNFVSDKEVPNFESEKVNFIDYFIPRQDPHEVVAPTEKLIDKGAQIKGSDVLAAGKKTKKRNLPSGATSSELQSSSNLNDNQGKKRKPQGGASDATHHQKPLSKDEKSETVTHANRKKAQNTHENDKFDAISKKTLKTKNSGASKTGSPVHTRVSAKISSKETTATFPASSSSSESSENRVARNKGSIALESLSNHYRVAFRKASNNITGKVLESSKHEKSLLASSDTIFKESHSDSSDDEGEVNNSDASTRSPSDSSYSSDYSEGSYDGTQKENGVNSPKLQSPGPKNMSLDMILRSSSRYKKAKLAASQSQTEDFENQPIDFVLDSLADT